ncbi:MAG: D-glycero-beta-D-manno-heptose 1,7-bisphosphate 7-phosphatase [Thalassotalea sp.]
MITLPSTTNLKPAIFLDRDGVINKEINYLHKIEDFEFTQGCISALQKMQASGYLLFIITNQAGIGRGYYTEEDFHTLNTWMLNTLKKNNIHITEVRFCPHHPTNGIGEYKIDCNCRKPKTGMLKPLIDNYQIDTQKSILIGDKLSDITAGESANISTLILVKSGHKLPEHIPPKVDYVLNNLSNVTDEILHTAKI